MSSANRAPSAGGGGGRFFGSRRHKSPRNSSREKPRLRFRAGKKPTSPTRAGVRGRVEALTNDRLGAPMTPPDDVERRCAKCATLKPHDAFPGGRDVCGLCQLEATRAQRRQKAAA